MARIRTIKPDFFLSLTVTALPVTARLTFIGLWTYVDDEGRGIDERRLVKAAVWPLDDAHDADAVEQDLEALATAGLVIRYRSPDGRQLLQVKGFDEHQRVNRPVRSKLPAPPHVTPPPNPSNPDTDGRLTEDSLRTHGRLTEDSLAEGKGKEGKGREGEVREGAPDDGFSELRDSFPDVARACDGYDPQLLSRFLSAVAPPGRAIAVEARRAYLGRAQRALGMGAPGLAPADLASAISDWVDNLAAGSEQSPNAGRFEAYLRKAKRRATTAPVGGEDPAELLGLFQEGRLLAFSGSTDAYWLRVAEVAQQEGRDPDEFTRLVKHVRAWDLGQITWPPDRLARVRQRLAAPADDARPQAVA